MTKKIYFEPAGRIHSAQRELINYPPDGYDFVVDNPSKTGEIVTSDFFLFTSRRLLEWLLPLNLTKAKIESYIKNIPQDIDLVYAYNHPVFHKKPWIVFAEWAHVLVGRDIRHFPRYKRLVEKLLASDYCKGILTWTELAEKSILLNFNCADFEQKLEVVPQAVNKKDFIKDYKEGKVKLLFVGSANVPHGFYYKGGKEVLEVFSILNRKFENLELVIRIKIPQNVKDKYKETLAMENVRVIEEIQPWLVLEEEFMTADIFVYPTHELHNTVILDAMSYELPVVTTEIGSTGRLQDGVTGFIVKSSEKVPYFSESLIPIGATPQRHMLARAIQTVDSGVLDGLVEKTSLLIENPELRRRMGKAAKQEVEEGKFSIKNRNEKLKRIFDEATSTALGK